MLYNEYFKFKNKLLSLNSQIYSIVKIMYFYNFSSIVLNLFFGIIIYQVNNSLLDLLIYSLIMICFSDLSFFVLGIIASIYKISMKKIYYISILLNIISYIWLILNHSHINDFYIFAILHGVSIGIYWLCLHTFELLQITDKERDFYSSILSIGGQFLKLIIPFVSSIIFILSVKIFDNEYLLLLYIVPVIYMFTLFPLNKISNFKAKELNIREFKNNLNSKESKIITLYTFFDSFKFGNLIVLNSYITIISLKSLLNVGIVSTIFAIITIIITGYISNLINRNNRMYIMLIGVSGVIIAYIPLYYDINIYTFIWWSLLLIIFNPLYQITSRVINLYSMDKLIVNDSFYTGMLYRTLILWIGRTTSLSFFIYLYIIFNDEKSIIITMITLFLISYITEYIMAKKIMALK